MKSWTLTPSLDLPAAIEEFASYADEPNADAGALPVWFLSKMTRQTATVALSGEGADELLGGYLTYRANDWPAWHAGFLRALRRWRCRGARRMARVGRKNRPRIQAEAFSRRLPDAAGARARVLERDFSDEEKQRLLAIATARRAG